jgi:HSP20 family molecular chaperone IbpA
MKGGIMSNLPLHRQTRSLLPEFADLFAAFPSFTGLRPTFDKLLRLEDELKEGRYEVRAEIPGIDPGKDVEVSVRDGLLTIKAERSAKKEVNGRSEFSYGSFERSVTLPAGANEDDIKATYDKGILTVSVGVNRAEPQAKRITVESAD